ncbi:hypothetical protein P8452_67494 [Trifolium repens]|nr:hypothetical protein P8452_67494 [Trifolium repens]
MVAAAVFLRRRRPCFVFVSFFLSAVVARGCWRLVASGATVFRFLGFGDGVEQLRFVSLSGGGGGRVRRNLGGGGGGAWWLLVEVVASV